MKKASHALNWFLSKFPHTTHCRQSYTFSSGVIHQSLIGCRKTTILAIVH